MQARIRVTLGVILAVILPALFGQPCYAQRENVHYAIQYANTINNTVGKMVAAAQADCNLAGATTTSGLKIQDAFSPYHSIGGGMTGNSASVAIPCFIVIDSPLVKYPSGTMPAIYTGVYLEDYRAGLALGGITGLSGDVTAGGAGVQQATLAAVNGSPGACGDITHVCQVSTDAKGRVISQTPVNIAFPAATGLSAASLPIVEYLLTEGNGSYAHNAQSTPIPSPNLLNALDGSYLTQWGPNGTGTLTDNYGVSSGGFSTERLQSAASANSGMRLQNNAPNIPAGATVTVSVTVVSNTGANQVIRFAAGTPGITYQADQTIGVGPTRISYTFTNGGSGAYVLYLLNGSASNALDVSIYNLKLEYGTQATPYELFAFNGNLNGTWGGGAVAFNGTSQEMVANSSVPVAVAQASVYVVAKKNGAGNILPWEPVFTSPAFAAANSQLGIFLQSGTTYPRFAYANATLDAPLSWVTDSRFHMVAGTYDGTTMSLYVDDVLVGTQVSPGLGAVGLQSVALGYYNSAFGGVSVGYVAVYPVAHTGAQVAAKFASLTVSMAAKGVTIAPTANIVNFEGDSITAIDVYTPQTMQGLAGNNTQGFSTSVAGSCIAAVAARASAVNAVQIAGKRNILTLLLGANDLYDGGCEGSNVASFETQVQAYLTAARAAGWKVVVSTMLPTTRPNANVYRATYNTWLRANWRNFADALADPATDATVGCDACAANATYYNGGLHPTTAGGNLIAPFFRAAIEGLMQ